jgi:hypothetical protein
VITRTRPADLRAEHNLVWGNALIGGHLYWATNMSRYPQAPFRVHVYDLASGQASTRPGVATTPPVGTAYGVSYDTAHGEVIVRNALPPTVAAAMGRAGSAGRRSLVTDGSAYAWIAAPGHVAWWRPGQPAPTVFREPYPRRPGLLVAGTYVMLGGVIQGGDAVLDVRTGAVAPLTRSTTFRAAGAGVFWGDGGAFAARTIVSVPVAGLPELHCD